MKKSFSRSLLRAYVQHRAVAEEPLIVVRVQFTNLNKSLIVRKKMNKRNAFFEFAQGKINEQ